MNLGDSGRFEPELEARTTMLFFELHNIPVASIIDETNVETLELKVQIAPAEDTFGL